MLSACSYVYADKFTACVQNVPLPERMHASERLLHTCPTFSETIKTPLHSYFVDLGVKINGAYYRDVLLTQKLLAVIRQMSGNDFVFQQDSAPAHRAHETIRQMSGNDFVFQQDSAPAHRAHETIELLRRETCWTSFH